MILHVLLFLSVIQILEAADGPVVHKLALGSNGSLSVTDENRWPRPEYRALFVPSGQFYQVNFVVQNCTTSFNIIAWHTTEDRKQSIYTIKKGDDMRLVVSQFHIWYMFDSGNCEVSWEVVEKDELFQKAFNKWKGIIYHDTYRESFHGN